LKHHDIYRYIIEKIPYGIYIISQDRLEYVNPAFEKIAGICRKDISALGLNFLNLIHPEDRELLLKRRKVRKEGKTIPSTFEIRGIAKDGTLKYLEFNTTPLPGHDDYVLGMVRDITELKLAEETLKESEARYKTIIEKANEGIMIIQDGLIKFINPYLLKDSGYTQEDLIDKPFRKFIATDYLDQIIDINERRKAGESGISSYEAVFKTKYGKRLFVEINVSEITYKGKPGFFTVIHNITKHKELENELKETLGKLREAINTTTQAIAMIVEQRDPYTAGHQRRVADLARAIAAELGLSSEQIDAVHMAGLLHDLGKISVPAEILTKPTKLTEAEFGLIMSHPQVAYDILKSIAFPWPIADIIHQHHERIDGSGYPRGLSDEDILIDAKILAVADTVEAIITNRPYREARPLKDALEEISRNKGILYDSEVAEACLRIFKEKGFSFKTESSKGK